MPHTSCCMSDDAHCMSTTTDRIWHTACRIPKTSSDGATSSSSSSCCCCCCCCCRHTSCQKPHAAYPIPHPPHGGRQRETRPLQSPRSRPHQPTPTPHMKGDNRRQWETTGDKTTSEPKKPTTPTNTHPLHEGRQWETTGDKTTSEPKKPTTPTNTKAARSKVALRTPTVHCLGNEEPHFLDFAKVNSIG